MARDRERHYRDSFDEQYSLESGAEVVTPDRYDDGRRTLNHPMARAARHGLIFPREQGTEGRYRHDGDTCNEWDVVTMERLEMAAEYGRSAAQRRELERDGRIVGRVGRRWKAGTPTYCIGGRRGRGHQSPGSGQRRSASQPQSPLSAGPDCQRPVALPQPKGLRQGPQGADPLAAGPSPPDAGQPGLVGGATPH